MEKEFSLVPFKKKHLTKYQYSGVSSLAVLELRMR